MMLDLNLGSIRSIQNSLLAACLGLRIIQVYFQCCTLSYISRLLLLVSIDIKTSLASLQFYLIDYSQSFLSANTRIIYIVIQLVRNRITQQIILFLNPIAIIIIVLLQKKTSYSTASTCYFLSLLPLSSFYRHSQDMSIEY